MSDQTPPAPEQIARAALASLSKSVNAVPKSRLIGIEKRDADLKALPNYGQPEWKKIDRESTGKEISTASTLLMGKLWELMTDLYGHKWTSVHGLADESGNWAKVMGGITPAMLASGARAWINQGGEASKWPPGAPELRDMCLMGGNGLGIPDVATAWREAVEASGNPTEWKFSHPIVSEAARLTDWYSIRTGTPRAETVQNRFGKRYADLTAKLQRGEPLIEGQKLISQETAASELDRSDKANEFLIQQRIKDQGLAGKSPAELRAAIREKLGMKP